jgi:hypothetical protein
MTLWDQLGGHTWSVRPGRDRPAQSQFAAVGTNGVSWHGLALGGY